MPRRDGRGPFGEGSMTGRGFGICGEEKREGYGKADFGRGRAGMGRKCRGRGMGAGRGRMQKINNSI